MGAGTDEPQACLRLVSLCPAFNIDPKTSLNGRHGSPSVTKEEEPVLHKSHATADVECRHGTKRMTGPRDIRTLNTSRAKQNSRPEKQGGWEPSIYSISSRFCSCWLMLSGFPTCEEPLSWPELAILQNTPSYHEGASQIGASSVSHGSILRAAAGDVHAVEGNDRRSHDRPLNRVTDLVCKYRVCVCVPWWPICAQPCAAATQQRSRLGACVN